jgi:hypothetical protein
MAVTRVDMYQAFKRLTSSLNAGVSSAFTAVLDDPRRSPGELFASLQAADDEICTLIAETEGHGFRPLFLSDSVDLTHNDQLPDRLGPVAQVKIKYASTDSDYRAGKFDKDLTLADIERWRANVGGIYGPAHDAANSSISGYYLVIGDGIYFTGSACKVKVATYTRTSREVLDGAMGSGVKVLTGTLLATADDQGAGVLVDGAGVSSVPLVSRIDAFTNSGSVTLRDANASGGSISGKYVVIVKLQCPQAYEDGLLAFAVNRQVKRGDNPPFAELWLRAAESYRARIGAGEMVIPKLELAQAA